MGKKNDSTEKLIKTIKEKNTLMLVVIYNRSTDCCINVSCAWCVEKQKNDTNIGGKVIVGKLMWNKSQ